MDFLLNTAKRPKIYFYLNYNCNSYNDTHVNFMNYNYTSDKNLSFVIWLF
jgi:hypothetical protein